MNGMNTNWAIGEIRNAVSGEAACSTMDPTNSFPVQVQPTS